METALHQRVAFFLSGNRVDGLGQIVTGQYRPALYARVSDLASLRYDLPLVLNGHSVRPFCSLSSTVDRALATLEGKPNFDRFARHAYLIEERIRRDLACEGYALHHAWQKAAEELSSEIGPEVMDSAQTVFRAFDCDGEIADLDAQLPFNVMHHVWAAVQDEKLARLRGRCQRLLYGLKDILAAEEMRSKAGRAPEKLKAGVGTGFSGAFDFEAMSSLLVEAAPPVHLPATRKQRIRALVEVLESQRFVPVADEVEEPYSFAFERCEDARTAYEARHPAAVEFVKALLVAELEVSGEYRDTVHDAYFADFGAHGLSAKDLADLPCYLICVDSKTMDPAEISQMMELLAAGLPFKVLAVTDDVLRPSRVAEGHVTLGLRNRQLVNSAMALNDVFVLQAPASHLFQMRKSLLAGMSYGGPALYSVFSGLNEHYRTVAPYLVAGAALESRAFPILVYNPAAGPDWASRFSIEGNPQLDQDWPTHEFAYEGPHLEAHRIELPFTLVDFLAGDDRFTHYFARLDSSDLEDPLVTVPEFMERTYDGIPDRVPTVALVDEDHLFLRAIPVERLMIEAERCRSMWRSLQELGGINNSHVREALSRKEVVATEEVTTTVQAAEETPVAAASAAPSSDEAYIETDRCTSCNECTNLNNKMFAYNENKQAFIKDVTAGTYRQLVEAAEGCQVSIIHPGKPRNPNEPGLDDLMRRAAAFA